MLNSGPAARRKTRRDLAFLTAFLLGALLLLSMSHEHKLAVATALRSSILLPVLKLQDGFTGFRGLNVDIEQLRAERDSLASRLVELQAVEEDNRRLRALLPLAARNRGRFLPANLYPTGSPGGVIAQSFVLDVGGSDGVSRDAPVVAASGLVGVVRIVTESQATGDFWTHPDFRVSAMTEDGRVYGIIQAVDSAPPLMQLEGTPFQVELTPGTRLLTSGQGGVFPRGIPVGEIIEIRDTEAGWSKSYLVEPAAYPDAVREVMVLVEGTRGDDMRPPGEPSDSGGGR